MSTSTRAWEIHYQPGRRAGAASGAHALSGSDPVRAAEEHDDAPAPAGVNPRTTGVFTVPNGEGADITLGIYLSSFATEEVPVTVRVYEHTAGTRTAIFTRTLRLPAGEARVLQVSDVAGQRLQVWVDAPESIVPSAAATQFFIADGGILVRLYKSPADFSGASS